MNKSELFKAAHKLTKEVIKTGDNYRVTFGAAIKFILEGINMETYVIEVNNAWTGRTNTYEIQAASHKEAVEKFEAAERKKVFYVSKKIQAPAIEVEDAETILFEMDMTGTDSMKFKVTRKSVVITRKQCQDWINYANSIKRVSRRNALAGV